MCREGVGRLRDGKSYPFPRSGALRGLALIFLLLIAGCGSDGKRADLVILNGAEPESIDPAVVTGQLESRICYALFEGLLRFDRFGEPQPGLAESWNLSSDGKTYTFHLRANGRWSNGDPVTARDFAQSWKRILLPETASEYAYLLYHIKNAESFNEGKLTDFSQVGITVIDDRTLQIGLEAPVPYFLDLCCFMTFLPVHMPTVEKYGDNWIKPDRLVNDGPFRLKEWRLNYRIRLEKNPSYWDAEHVALNTIVEDVHRAMTTADETLLDFPQAAKPLEFFTRLEPRDSAVLGLLRQFHSRVRSGRMTQVEWDRRFLRLAAELVRERRDCARAVANLPAARHSTRVEIYGTSCEAATSCWHRLANPST